MDTGAANYYFQLKEDGSLSWSCSPYGSYAESPLNDLVCNGFFEKMREYSFSGATFQYMLDSAYNAGSNPKLHNGFNIPHVSNGFTFRFDASNPNVSFHINENGQVAFRRNNVFSDKRIMDKFDAGVWAYIAANSENIKTRIHQNEIAQQEYEIDQQKRSGQYNLQTAVLLPYFLITSIIAVSMFGGGKIGLVFSTVFCITSAVANLSERNHPIKMHTFLLITLGLVNMLVTSILKLW